MITSPDKQWRIDNARRLQGLRLQFRRYTRWSESWDHDHCAACWATFAEVAGPDIQHEGYATREDYIKGACYDWICQSCFNDLKDDMGWSAVNGPASMLAEARRKIGELAVAMLTGSVSFIEGARAINHLRFKAELDLDSDIIVFVGIDSETDALPLGEVRKLWDPNALANLQPEIDKAERWARGVGTPHCENLARRFS